MLHVQEKVGEYSIPAVLLELTAPFSVTPFYIFPEHIKEIMNASVFGKVDYKEDVKECIYN